MDKLIVANWKMNMATVAEIEEFFENFFPPRYERTQIVICPNFLNIATIAEFIDEDEIYLGAQDISAYEGGAYTGEISAATLDDADVDFVIVGHSERRTHLGETDKMINEKIKRALEYDITPILCIGETLAQREGGKTEEVLANQIKLCLHMVDAEKVVVAYEPVWAIGTGQAASIDDIAEVHAFIRNILPESKILYGGSVTDKNARSIMAIENVDGVLVGGAALDPEKFAEIIRGSK